MCTQFRYSQNAGKVYGSFIPQLKLQIERYCVIIANVNRSTPQPFAMKYIKLLQIWRGTALSAAAIVKKNNAQIH